MIEKRIITAAVVFVLTLAGVIGLTVKQLGIGLPTCLTDVRPSRSTKPATISSSATSTAAFSTTTWLRGFT